MTQIEASANQMKKTGCHTASRFHLFSDTLSHVLLFFVHFLHQCQEKSITWLSKADENLTQVRQPVSFVCLESPSIDGTLTSHMVTSQLRPQRLRGSSIFITMTLFLLGDRLFHVYDNKVEKSKKKKNPRNWRQMFDSTWYRSFHFNLALVLVELAKLFLQHFIQRRRKIFLCFSQYIFKYYRYKNKNYISLNTFA